MRGWSLQLKDRILALDIGDKRIGVAVSDPFGISGTPLAVLKNSPNVFNEIKKIVDEYKPQKIVVGLPLTLKGEEGEQAKKTKEFVEKLKEHIPDIEIVFEDERFTSQMAEERLSQIFKSKKKIKNKIDAVSAVVILESYLEKNPLWKSFYFF